MNLADIRTRVKAYLSLDAQVSDANLDQLVYRAVDDMNRVLPQEKVLELTVYPTFTDVSFTWGAEDESWVDLPGRMIKYQSEVIKDSNGNTLVRNTDYEIDYTNGRVRARPGQVLLAPFPYTFPFTFTGNFTITYTLSDHVLPLDAYVDDIYRINRVESPYAQSAPRNNISYEVHGENLYIVAPDYSFKHGDHYLVYYSTPYAKPTEATAGEWPSGLDHIVIKGTTVYALMHLMTKYEHLAASDLDLSRTTLGLVVTAQGKLTTLRAAMDATLALIAPVRAQIVNIESALSSASTELNDPTLILTNVGFNITTVRTSITATHNKVQDALNSIPALLVLAKSTLELAFGASTDPTEKAATALDDCAGIFTLLATALGKVDTNITAGQGNLTSAEAISIAANLTATGTALTAVATALTAAGTSLGNMGTPLTAIATQLTEAVSILTAASNSAEDTLVDGLLLSTDITNLLNDAGTFITGYDTNIDEVKKWIDDASYMNVSEDLAGIQDELYDGASQSIQLKDLTPIETILGAAGVILTALTAAETEWSTGDDYLIGNSDPSAKKYLTDGDAFLNTVNLGEQVSASYAKYAEVAAGITRAYEGNRDYYLKKAEVHLSRVQGYLADGNLRVAMVDRLIESGKVRLEIARTFIQEVEAKSRQGQDKLQQAAIKVQQLQAIVQLGVGLVQTAVQVVAAAEAYRGQAEGFKSQADGYLRQAEGYRAQASGYLETVNAQLTHMLRYIEASQARIAMAEGFVQEARTRAEAINAKVAVAQAWLQTVRAYLDESGGYVQIASGYFQQAQGWNEEIGLLVQEFNALNGQAGAAVQHYQAIVSKMQMYVGQYNATIGQVTALNQLLGTQAQQEQNLLAEITALNTQAQRYQESAAAARSQLEAYKQQVDTLWAEYNKLLDSNPQMRVSTYSSAARQVA